ncbi:MAG: hypothetical protein BA863_09215 [Desulfovibrio sp. S3730MH75]|nr:MAG: hypothetical protein BA863_09215 [Desulfovibrio sp. S3730MH75]
MDFELLASKYLDEIQDRKKRNTYIYKRSTFRRFISYFHPARVVLSELNLDIIANYHRAQKEARGPKAANCDLRELRTIFNWAIKRDHMIKNPARQVDYYSEEDFVRYVPPAEDISAVRMAATPEERLFFDALYFTAARLSEILNLTWEDINLESRAIRLWTSKRAAGNKQPRVLAIHDELYKLLSTAWDNRDKTSSYVFTNPLTGNPYTRHNAFVKDMFKRLCERANLERTFTAHCIRHHVASRIVDSRKATLRQLQSFLGHMNSKVTDKYVHELQVDHSIMDAFESSDPEADTAQNEK